jgi:hypothetical protein
VQAEEEDVVIPLLLEWCRQPEDVLRWQQQNALRGLCSCRLWFCAHRRRELQLITAPGRSGESEISLLGVLGAPPRVQLKTPHFASSYPIVS